MARIPSVFRLLLLTAVFAALVVGRGPSNVSAGGLTVNTTTDAVDANPGADGCMTAEANCSLRAAIQEANASSGTDSIIVPAGTYVLSVADGDGSTDLDVTSALTLNGGGAGITILDGGDLDRVLDVDTPSAVFVSNVTVRNGTATSIDGNGGGIRHEGGQLLLSNMAIEDNSTSNAQNGGGGLFNASGSATITDSTISGNSSAVDLGGDIVLIIGGGIMSGGGSVTVTNVTISGNSGGVAAEGGSLTANNATISQNIANQLLSSNGGSITASNTIIAGEGNNCFVFVGGTISSAGHNLSNDATCPLTAGGDLPNADPLLGPLADNGGPTLTHAIQPLSPAVDAGDDIFCSDTDQRGIDRPQGAHCDIGAFEVEVPIAQGDVDCSQGIDAVDALKVLRFAASLSVAQTEPCPEPPSLVAGFPFGDVDCNNVVNAVDGLKILRHNAALSVTQTEPCPDIGQQL